MFERVLYKWEEKESKAGMTKALKIMYVIQKVCREEFSSLPNTRTQGYSVQLTDQRYVTEERKYPIMQHTTKLWSLLQQDVAMATTQF